VVDKVPVVLGHPIASDESQNVEQGKRIARDNELNDRWSSPLAIGNESGPVLCLPKIRGCVEPRPKVEKKARISQIDSGKDALHVLCLVPW